MLEKQKNKIQEVKLKVRKEIIKEVEEEYDNKIRDFENKL